MRNCTEREAQLNDLLDDLLSADSRAELDRHLRECAGCRETLADLRTLRVRTSELPHSLEPERDLWPAIRGSLARGRGGIAGVLTQFWTRTDSPGGSPVPRSGRILATAAAALALLVAGIVAIRRAPATSGGPTAPPPDAALLRHIESEYLGPTAQLRAALDRQRGAAPPGSLEVLEDNLRIVDEAIRQVRSAADRDPDRTVDEQLFANLHRTQFRLLQQAVRLSSQDTEEQPI